MLLGYKLLLWENFIALDDDARREVTVFDRFFTKTVKIRKVHSSDEK